MISEGFTRLHITPFNPNLLTTILPPPILPNARNISYHSIQTFPEKGFGYVELPTMDAEKIKKKLNGSILKGTKVRIEKARPEKELPITEDKPERPKKQKDASKKRKRDETIPAIDIGARSVKRGWTTPAAAEKKGKDKDKSKDKKTVKSKYTASAECLFKTVLPPNAAANTIDAKPEKKRRKVGKETVVHEFAKTTKYASFLRGNAVPAGVKGVAAFVDSKGWVDEEGNVVEEYKKSKKITAPQPTTKAISPQQESSSEESSDAALLESDKSATSDSKKSIEATGENDSSDASSSEDEPAPYTALPDSSTTLQLAEKDPETSTSGSSSEESESDHESDSSDSSKNSVATSSRSKEYTASHSISRPKSSSGPPPGLNIKIPPSANATPVSAVHPLEALYKKPKGHEASSREDVPTFSFFDADDDADEDNHVPIQPPLTPFTQRDFEYRGIRSTAPTPDTAHPNKRFVWPTDKSDDEEGDDVGEGPSSPIRNFSKPGDKEDAVPESDFQKWFYEHRGETTRAWKKRRRTAAKEARHRENKKREQRAI